jgi:hypothetical protein
VKHRETHPSYVEGCFGCKITTVAPAAACTPGRRYETHATNHREAMLHRDRDAYRRLRADGTQPPRIDGCAALERAAEHPLQIEMGYLGDAKKFDEGERISKDLGVAP